MPAKSKFNTTKEPSKIPDPTTTNTTTTTTSLPLPTRQEFYNYLQRQACGVIQLFIEQLLLVELEELLECPWGQSSPKRKGYRNGYRTRSLLTRQGAIEHLQVPRDREGKFQGDLFQRYSRYEPELRQGMLDMYVAGAS